MINIILQPKEASDNVTEVNEATCQYDYMMRALQPDVPCPDNLTILTLLEYHNHFMSVPSQNDEMCSEMSYPTEMKTAMVCSYFCMCCRKYFQLSLKMCSSNNFFLMV